MPSEKKVTIYDVANYAGVAISTVSRVLNNSPEVSEKTRRRIQSAIDTLHFRPARTAKMLALSSTQSLSVAVPSFTSPYLNELLKGVKDTLSTTNKDLILCNLGSESPRDSLLEFLNRGTVDALLIAALHIDKELHHELKMLNAPVVIIGQEVEGFDCYFSDDRLGSERAIEHLIETGHREIAILTAHEISSNSDARLKGYKDALEKHGIPFNPRLVARGTTRKHAGFCEEAGYEAMTQLLRSTAKFSAIFATSDVQAIGAWLALNEAKKNIPNDFALMGYDNIKISKYIGLSSVDQYMYHVGKMASEVVLSRMGDRDSPRIKHFIEPKVVRRTSTQR